MMDGSNIVTWAEPIESQTEAGGTRRHEQEVA